MQVSSLVVYLYLHEICKSLLCYRSNRLSNLRRFLKTLPFSRLNQCNLLVKVEHPRLNFYWVSIILHWRIYSKSCFGQHKWIKSSNMALGHENAEILHFFCALVFFNNCLLRCILSNIGIEHSLISSYPTSNSRKMIQIKGYCFNQGGRRQSNIGGR